MPILANLEMDPLVIRLLVLNCLGMLGINLSALMIYLSLAEDGIVRSALTSASATVFIAGSLLFLLAWTCLATSVVLGTVGSRLLSYGLLIAQGICLIIVCCSGLEPAHAWDGLTLYFDEAAKLLDVVIGANDESVYSYSHRRHGILGVLYAGSWGAVGVTTVIGSVGVNLLGLLPVLQLITVSFAVGRLWRLSADELVLLSLVLASGPLFLNHAVGYGYQEVWVQAHLVIVMSLQLVAISRIDVVSKRRFSIYFWCPLLFFLPALLLKNLAWLYGASLLLTTCLLYIWLCWRALAPWILSGMTLIFMVPLVVGFDLQLTDHPSSRVALVWEEPKLISFGGRDEALVFADLNLVMRNFFHAFFINSSFAGIFLASLIIACFGTRMHSLPTDRVSLIYLVMLVGFGFVFVNGMQVLERFSNVYGAQSSDLGLSRFNLPLTAVMGMFVISGFLAAKQPLRSGALFEKSTSDCPQ